MPFGLRKHSPNRPSRSINRTLYLSIITIPMHNLSNKTSRITWIDFLRVFAIFLVIIVHSTEPFYLGGPGSYIASCSDAWWVSFFDSFARACVPLFVIASSYLLLPMTRPVGEFFRRRLVRVVVPFIIWTVLYAWLWGDPTENFTSLLLNFNYAAGHLWFVYMLVGIYLLIPMLSPWAMTVSRRQLLFYIGLFLLTTLIPFVRESAAVSTPVIYGSTGIPNPAKFPLWGECSWNNYGTFYYLSGFIGYVLIGLYFRRFMPEFNWSRTLLTTIPVWIAGFAICFGGFLVRVFDDAAGQFPVEGPSGMAAMWETPWINDTIGVVLMAIGWILLLRKYNRPSRILLAASNASYGVYLCHMFILAPTSALLQEQLSSTPLIIISTAIITFLASTAICYLIGRIPRVGKYIVG